MGNSTIVAAIFVALMVFFLAYAFLAPVREKETDSIQEDIFGNKIEEVPTDSIGKYVKPILGNFLPQLPKINLSKDRIKSFEVLLTKSNNPWKLTVEEFVGIIIAFGILGGLAGSIISVMGLVPMEPAVLIVGGLLAGAAIPYSMHNNLRQSRTKEIERNMPDALDLMTVTLSSGETFQPALESVGRQMPESILKEEFGKLTLNIASGVSVEKSLNLFTATNDAEDVENFAKAIIQTTRLGADVSETLRQQAAFTRASHEARIERMIARLSTTMFIPLILTMMPAFLVIFLAPSMAGLQNGGAF